jgi:hypothetical protein
MIDAHPMARRRVKSGRSPIFFCLEGSLNADAILSHGHPSISVPVSRCGRLRNLGDFLPYIQRAPVVYLVTDSDWSTNEYVALQAVKAVR